MPLIPAGYQEATIIMKALASTRVNTFAIGLNDDLVVDPDPAELAEEVYIRFTATGAPGQVNRIANTWQLLGVSVTKMLESGPVVGEYMATLTGTGAISTVPNNTSLLVSKRTALGGRRNRGRMFVPPFGLSEAAVDTVGLLSGAELSSQQGVWTAFRSGLVAANFSPLLFHQSAPFTPTPITAFVVNQLCATQRRRMRK